jgi:hypothetical protein
MVSQVIKKLLLAQVCNLCPYYKTAIYTIPLTFEYLVKLIGNKKQLPSKDLLQKILFNFTS